MGRGGHEQGAESGAEESKSAVHLCFGNYGGQSIQKAAGTS
jgi:hypothetical protein